MRIIGGIAKGRRLVVPKGEAVRPTADRVKESLFNILPRDFSGKRILDLFAGTGNLSIEALSRGAERATLVEASERSAGAIRENLRRLEFGDRADVWVLPVVRALRSLAKRRVTFDMIFLDPPYDHKVVAIVLKLIAQGNLVDAIGTVVAEHSAREAVQTRYDTLILNDQRRYGDTLLSFFKHTSTSDPAD
ncbi:MAG TPA: 16S rRNA (guanine(966)-N(2))-methyltransferase RsmD [Candidatus Binatia bacterium]